MSRFEQAIAMCSSPADYDDVDMMRKVIAYRLSPILMACAIGYFIGLLAARSL
ncbi:hypothetical protein ACFLSZ_01625 [Candidatus Bipolaricaulota bacterium]